MSNVFVLAVLTSIFPLLLQDEIITLHPPGAQTFYAIFDDFPSLIITSWRCVVLMLIFFFSVFEPCFIWRDLNVRPESTRLISYFALRTFFLTLAATSSSVLVLFIASQGITLLSSRILRF